MAEHGIFSIGHSNHPLGEFLSLLARHAVNVVADVRSVPYSRRNPAYNRESLARSLGEAGVEYRFLGAELGAKSSDPACYVDGRVRYRRLAARAEFKRGLASVLEAARGRRLALLCAEKEPLGCHRTLLVAREIEALGTPVTHIHADGRLETHAEAVRRLRALVGVPESDLLRSQAELDDEAYALQERRIAYVLPPAPAPPAAGD